MFTVENDWIQYETVPARRVAVTGGATCAQRLPVRSTAAAVRALRPAAAVVAAPIPPRAVAPRRLRLTRRGRFVLVVLPGVLALAGAAAAVGASPSFEAAPAPAPAHAAVVAAHG